MQGFSQQAINGFRWFLIVCCVFRVLNAGFVLVFASWMVLPFYLIHMFGQIKMYSQSTISKTDKYLVYTSTILFLLATLFQAEQDVHKSYYLIEYIVGKQFPTPDPFSSQYLIEFGWIFAADIMINMYFIFKRSQSL